MRYPNHPKTWNLSSLRVFWVKTSIQNWHEIFSSAKNLKSFVVTGFLSKNVNSELTWDIQIIQKLEIFRRYGFLSKHVNSELTWDIQIIQKPWNLSTLRVCLSKHVNSELTWDIQIFQKPWNLSTLRVIWVNTSIQNWHEISKSSQNLEIFRRYGLFE